MEFKKVVRQLKGKDDDMFLKLSEIMSNIEFINANTYRNPITHNFSPNMPGLVRRTDDNGFVIEYVQEYFSSSVVYENIKSVLELLKRSIEVIKN
ncbi:Cthe_2314 family HEPN domain-containing protein [Paenibacillus sp. 7523-1]|uniref:Cthe_2314 family HEPN domain-containing protein n=1 Tax=Paenibacillus sp. 7523-1 TaxID=2022550 RepID=UPI0034E981F6